MESKTKFAIKLSSHIKKLRIEKGITGAELARRCDMEKSNLHRIEKGQTSPTVYMIAKICEALELDLQEFFRKFKY